MQGTLRALLALVVLSWIGVAVPTVANARQDPPPVDVTTATGRVQTVIDRADGLTGRIKTHPFAPAYFQPPCSPTKDDAERDLAPFRRDLRAVRAEAAALQARIEALEVNDANKRLLGLHGWDFQDLKRFRPLQASVQNAANALAALEAKLDAMPAKACRPPEPPRKPIKDGPLTTGEEGEFEDFPLPIPVFDDPVTLPTPPKFCSYAQRKAWMDGTYWPTAERAKQNAIKAIETSVKADRRLRDVTDVDREGSPRIALAKRSADYWRAEKDRRMAAQRAILDTDVPTPVDCETRKITEGGGDGPVTTPQPTKPITDGPVTPPPAKPKLPAPSLARPQFERIPEITVPTKFCSEFERNAFLTDVYNPAVAAALRNASTGQEHQARLNALFTQYMQANSEYWGAVRAERDAWEAIAAAATAKAEALRQMYAKIMAVPVLPCTETRTPPPPPPPPPEGSSRSQTIRWSFGHNPERAGRLWKPFASPINPMASVTRKNGLPISKN